GQQAGLFFGQGAEDGGGHAVSESWTKENPGALAKHQGVEPTRLTRAAAPFRSLFVAQLAPQNFSYRGFRKFVAKFNHARLLVASEVGATEFTQSCFGQIRCLTDHHQ